MDENNASLLDDEAKEPVEAEVVDKAEQVKEEIPSEPKKPGWVKRFMAWLFNEDSRFGRFNKSFLRLLVVIVLIFAAGVLVTYLVLYRPVKNQLINTTTTLRDTTTQLSDNIATLDEVEAALDDITMAYDNLTEDYAYTTAQNQLLRMYTKVVNAQMLIQNKKYADAKKELAEARTILDNVLPELAKVNDSDAERLDSRLDLVISEFGNDVKAAESDLDVMVDWILEFDTNLQELMN
jgi:cell division protein FtsL